MQVMYERKVHDVVENVKDLGGGYQGYGIREANDLNGEIKWVRESDVVEITEPQWQDFSTIGQAIGQLVDEKNKQYGDSFNKCGDFLKILYPNGVKPEQYTDMLGLTRMFDKFMRIANGNQGNENAWDDLCGYSLLGVKRSRGV